MFVLSAVKFYRKENNIEFSFHNFNSVIKFPFVLQCRPYSSGHHQIPHIKHLEEEYCFIISMSGLIF
jgi:hypothetical protein